MPAILSIDQSTTSTSAHIFVFAEGNAPHCVLSATRELPQVFPRDGWVEHNAETIWRDVIAVCREVLEGYGEAVAGIGITNQRETVVVWERASGAPLHNAIVWQDRRTADICAELQPHATLVSDRSGLLLDPYFSATKIAWALDHIPDARTRAEAGELAVGTIDSWLIYKLTDGARHVTDATNAARTSLFNIHTQEWDAELLDIFNVPRDVLPEVLDCVDDFGASAKAHLGAALPIMGVAGDQQAASIGQGCVASGMIKSTYGTGCFALLNTGKQAVASRHRLLTTIAYRLAGETHYALEGSIFMAGAIVQWLRDAVGILPDAEASARLAAAANPESQAMLVPAFTGLGAPYWDPHARAAMLGMGRDTGRAEIVRAALESVSLQTRDLLTALQEDMGAGAKVLRVDGGMVANDWFAQNLADVTQCAIDRPTITDTTALGAACLAALGCGAYRDLNALAEDWALDTRFTPQQTPDTSNALYARWQKAVANVLTS